MDALLKLTPSDQLDAYTEVNQAIGLDAASVEKDFWVCWTLRELFSTPGIGAPRFDEISTLATEFQAAFNAADPTEHSSNSSTK